MTHSLFDHLLYVGRRFCVIGAGTRPSKAPTFRLSPLLRLWMQSEKEQRPGQRQRGLSWPATMKLDVVQNIRR